MSAVPELANTSVYSTTALVLPRGLSEEEWENFGYGLAQINDSSNWWIGDWIAAGERAGWGALEAAAQILGKDAGTLSNIGSVARKIKPARRRAALPFSFHAEVVSLEEEIADGLLEFAEKDGWNRLQLRNAVKAEKAPGLEPGPVDPFHITEGEIEVLDPDEGETAAAPAAEPPTRFVDKKDEAVFGLTRAAALVREASSRVKDTMVVVAGDGFRLTIEAGTELARASHELTRVLDAESSEILNSLTSLGVEIRGELGGLVPKPAAKKDAPVAPPTTAGNVGTRAGQDADVSTGGMSDAMWKARKDTTVTLEEYREWEGQ